MRYRLDELASLAAELGFEARRIDAERLDVCLPGCVLFFCNPAGEEEGMVGFEGTGWHDHGALHVMTGENAYVNLDELEILTALAVGDLVIVSHYLDGVLRDRSIQHRLEPVQLKYIQPGEELRYLRLPKTKPS